MIKDEDKKVPAPGVKSQTPGYTPMQCSTQNVFSFKDKEYQK